MKLAFDKNSKRRKDENGFLHVAMSHISKEAVNPYMGDEIPGWEELELDPKKVYNCYRPADELEKAADSFNGLPILWGHLPESAEEPQKESRVGNMGTDAKFENPYLDNSLIFTDQTAIDAIENNERNELSCSYRWVPVIEKGNFAGDAYDIRMTNIKGNHLGLVEEGRAGGDVMVHDQKLKGEKLNVKDKIGKWIGKLTGALTSDSMEIPEELVEEFKEDFKKPEEEEKEDMGPEKLKEVFGKMSKDELKGVMDMCKDMFGEEESEDQENEEAKDQEKAEDQEEEKADDQEKAEDQEEEKAEDEEKKADDAKNIEASVMANVKKLTQAANDVRPVVGEIDALSFDSADKIYGEALKLKGVDISKHPESSYHGMFDVLRENSNTPVMANDHIGTEEYEGNFAGLNDIKIK